MNELEVGLESVVSWSTDAVATDVNGEVVLMHLEHDRCYGLGETGSAIWSRMREPVKVADLIATLRDEYDAPTGLIEGDVLRTLAEFADEGLIRIVRQ